MKFSFLIYQNMNNLECMCAVMQPTYIPWIGYFDLIDQTDKFIFLDDVQLEKNSWQLRNRIKTCQGELFLSINRKRNRGKKLPLIKEVEINDFHHWREKHIKTIRLEYQKADFFNEVYPFIESLINSDLTNLSQFNIKIIESISNRIGIKTDFLISSEIPDITGKKEQRVISICKSTGCKAYLSPVGAFDYIEEKSLGGDFADNNIYLYYHNYEHPRYNQLHGEFIPRMSIIDLLFNEGLDRSLGIIRQGHRDPIDYLSYRKMLETGKI